MKERVVVVTGGNRGIGLEICRQLASLGLIVVLTSRNEKDGLEAVEKFSKQELSVRYFPLDVTNPTQILQSSQYINPFTSECINL